MWLNFAYIPILYLPKFNVPYIYIETTKERKNPKDNRGPKSLQIFRFMFYLFRHEAKIYI